MALFNFRGITNYTDYQITQQLNMNVTEWLKWGFLNIGSWSNARVTSSGAYNQEFSRLRLVDSPSKAKGRVWEGFRGNWIWESGISFSSQPIRISGVYVDNTFYSSSTTGSFAHTVDYPNGRIIFNNAINPSSVVKAEFSYRHVNIYTNARWFKRVITETYRSDYADYNLFGSGVWNIFRENKIELPAVIVETIPRFKLYGYELGSQRTKNIQDVVFYVITETIFDRDQITDILKKQYNNTMLMFDYNLVGKNNKFPLNPNGNLASGALTYPDWIRATGDGGFCMGDQIIVYDIQGSPIDTQISSIYMSSVVWNTETLIN